MQAALDAVAPMVEKLLQMQSDGAYDMGWSDGEYARLDAEAADG